MHQASCELDQQIVGGLNFLQHSLTAVGQHQVTSPQPGRNVGVVDRHPLRIRRLQRHGVRTKAAIDMRHDSPALKNHQRIQKVGVLPSGTDHPVQVRNELGEGPMNLGQPVLAKGHREPPGSCESLIQSCSGQPGALQNATAETFVLVDFETVVETLPPLRSATRPGPTKPHDERTPLPDGEPSHVLRPDSRITPQSVEFVILSFEGPDLYSLVGGLGVRATELSHALAEQGFRTRLFFLGDPQRPYYEEQVNGLLSYHRWSQWLSAQFPEGVYHGEEAKINDFTASIPEHLIEQVVAPAAARGRTVVVLAEEWHTTGAVIALNRGLIRAGLMGHCLILWNANNVFGFESIDWQGLSQSCAITTVSRYMKHGMAHRGLSPLVIPNGIPSRWLEPIDVQAAANLRKVLPGLLLGKVGRYHPDKRWLMAMEATGALKRMGLKPKLIVRGSSEPYRVAISQKAFEQGLVWSEIHLSHPSMRQILTELKRHRDADVLELQFFVPEDFLRVLYSSADAILANSSHEPFGLVGLEVMACGGVAITGSSGEDYAHSFVNCLRIDSDDYREIVVYLQDLLAHPDSSQDIRSRAQLTSSLFSWELVTTELFRKIEFVAQMRGVSVRG